MWTTSETLVFLIAAAVLIFGFLALDDRFRNK